METDQLSFTDHGIITDMLFETKATIKDVATALTEATSLQVRTFLEIELKTAISQHEQVYNFLQDRGIYDAYNVPEQLQKDISYAEQALKL